MVYLSIRNKLLFYIDYGKATLGTEATIRIPQTASSNQQQQTAISNVFGNEYIIK